MGYIFIFLYLIFFLQHMKWMILNQITLWYMVWTFCCCFSSYLVPVQFTEIPQNITVNSSTPLFLRCNASGFPEPNIRWEKSGINMSHTKQLNIPSSNRNDAGEYVCIASNGVRQEKTVRAYVTVQCKSFFFQYVIKSCHCCWIHDTVQPILSSTIWSGHPVFNGQLPKSRIFLLNHCNFHLLLVITSINWSWSPLSEWQQPVCIVFHL